MKRAVIFWVALLFPAFAFAAAPSERFGGPTMGTFYHAKVVGAKIDDREKIQTVIDGELEAVEASMSYFRPDSEISRFNAMDVGGKLPISPGFLQVMKTARQVYELSGGAWDGTVKPLVELWGFGKNDGRPESPPPFAIAAVKMYTGFKNIEVQENKYLVKLRPRMELDLNSIAKGYGVEVVSKAIRELGFSDFLVEIGGEIVASGSREDGGPWRVGINHPRPGAPPDAVFKILAFRDKALATSGDYRKFFEAGGKRYSHVLDPRTGFPVKNGVVSASILADDCTLADGLATAVMVMGPEKGIALAESLDGVEAYIITGEKDGTLKEHMSRGFSAFFVK